MQKKIMSIKNLIGKKINININEKDTDKYPKIISKYNTREQGYIILELVYEDGEKYEARVTTISTTGNYIVEIIGKI